MRPSRPDPEEGAVFPCAPCAVGVVVVVTPPGGSSAVADGVTGPVDPGSPAYGVPAAAAPEGGAGESAAQPSGAQPAGAGARVSVS